jgi:hypothetical protein
MKGHHNTQHDTLSTANPPHMAPPREQVPADDPDLLTWEDVEDWALDPLPEEDEASARNADGMRMRRTVVPLRA